MPVSRQELLNQEIQRMMVHLSLKFPDIKVTIVARASIKNEELCSVMSSSDENPLFAAEIILEAYAAVSSAEDLLHKSKLEKAAREGRLTSELETYRSKN
jgi:hypothetical protein